MKKLKSVSILLLLLTFLGCASVSLQATKDPEFSNPMHKLFIILNHVHVDDIDPNFTPYLVKAIADGFSSENIEIRLRLISPTSLNGNDFSSEIEAYQPDGIMTVNTNGGISSGTTGGLMTIYYDVNIFEHSNKKRVWRARINASGGTAVHDKRMQKVAQEIIKRLKKDNIISSTSRKPSSTDA